MKTHFKCMFDRSSPPGARSFIILILHHVNLKSDYIRRYKVFLSNFLFNAFRVCQVDSGREVFIITYTYNLYILDNFFKIYNSDIQKTSDSINTQAVWNLICTYILHMKTDFGCLGCKIRCWRTDCTTKWT